MYARYRHLPLERIIEINERRHQNGMQLLHADDCKAHSACQCETIPRWIRLMRLVRQRTKNKRYYYVSRYG